MNILIFSQYFYPENFLVNEITAELVKHGNQVTVITGLPNYPSGVIEKEYRSKKIQREIINGVVVLRCPIIPRGKSKVQLILNYLSYMVSATIEGRKLTNNFDVVMSYQLTPIFQVYPAIMYAKKNNLKLIMYNLDLAPLCGSSCVEKSKIFFSIYSKFSSWIMNSCDHIAVTSESFISYNNKVNGVPLSKMTYLPQHASNTMLSHTILTNDNGVIDFVFAGNVGSGAGLGILVSVAERLRTDVNFKIHIVGDGSQLLSLKKKVADKGLTDYFVFHGRHSMEEMPRFYELADALLITLRPGQITIPAKLQTYMTTGKPVFGSMDGSGKDVINESGCGICVNAGDSDALAYAMREFIENPTSYDECGKRGLEYFKENFTLDIFMERFMKIISDVQK